MRHAWLVLAGCGGAVRPGPLAVGRDVANTMRPGDVQRYPIHLKQGDRAHVTIEQQGVDVVVSVFGPRNEKLFDIDSPNGDEGPEIVRLDADETGDYVLEVRPSIHPGYDPFAGAKIGHYVARVDKIESAAEIATAAAKNAAELDTFWRDRQGVVDAFTAWTKKSAMALEDPAALERVVGSARIVAFGEADHGVHEYLAARNLVFETLVEQLGFATYVGETGVADAFVVDDYINGVGTATSAQAAAAMFSWDGALALPENVELVAWMRAYNSRPNVPRKLHVYGMDFAGAINGLVVHARAAVDPVLAYLDRADPELARRTRQDIGDLLDRFDEKDYLGLGVAQRDRLSAGLSTLVTALETRRVALLARTGEASYQRAYRSAIDARQIDAFLRDTLPQSKPASLADVSLDGIRDAAMATNLDWIATHEPGRIFVFAHNAHVRRGPVMHWAGPVELPTSFGQNASALYGKDLVVIGGTRGDGADTKTFDALVHRGGTSRYMIDLRAAPDDLRAALAMPWELRRDDLAAYGISPFWTLIPNACFDAVVYFDKVTAIDL